MLFEFQIVRTALLDDKKCRSLWGNYLALVVLSLAKGKLNVKLIYRIVSEAGLCVSVYALILTGQSRNFQNRFKTEFILVEYELHRNYFL